MSDSHSLAYLRSLRKERGGGNSFSPNCALGEIIGSESRSSHRPAEKFWLQEPSALLDSWALPSWGMEWPAFLNSLMRCAAVLSFLLWAFRLSYWWLPLVLGLLVSALGGLLTSPIRVAPEGGVTVLDLSYRAVEEHKS